MRAALATLLRELAGACRRRAAHRAMLVAFLGAGKWRDETGKVVNVDKLVAKSARQQRAAHVLDRLANRVAP